MKIRESGMPSQEYWESFFDSKKLVDTLFSNSVIDENITEFGSGYGTFTFPAALYTTKTLFASFNNLMGFSKCNKLYIIT